MLVIIDEEKFITKLIHEIWAICCRSYLLILCSSKKTGFF